MDAPRAPGMMRAAETGSDGSTLASSSLDDKLDAALVLTFPASDPVAVTAPATIPSGKRSSQRRVRAVLERPVRDAVGT